jgi:hypothetical protein
MSPRFLFLLIAAPISATIGAFAGEAFENANTWQGRGAALGGILLGVSLVSWLSLFVVKKIYHKKGKNDE